MNIYCCLRVFVYSLVNLSCFSCSHIYHYYLHGPNGNTGEGKDDPATSIVKGIDIQVMVCLNNTTLMATKKVKC